MQDLLIPSDLARVILVLLEKSTGFVGFGDFCWILLGVFFLEGGAVELLLLLLLF